MFQYPLFRIVDCFTGKRSAPTAWICVSISALSDRGLLQIDACDAQVSKHSFNIRSFGSWIASKPKTHELPKVALFQYPLFRIVDCFHVARRLARMQEVFQYPLFRIVDCFRWDGVRRVVVLGVSISALSDRGLLPKRNANIVQMAEQRFNIRSFGSWIASAHNQALYDVQRQVSISALSDRGLLRDNSTQRGSRHRVSISALSDRGLLRSRLHAQTKTRDCFNIRSFGSWIASRHRIAFPALARRFNIRSFGSWIASGC